MINMIKYLLCLSLLASGPVLAGDLAKADALFAKKDFAQAMALYAKLAKTGDAKAQLHMGEMHLYGDGRAVDLVKAEEWFKLSAAQGNKTAIAALEMMKQRELRRAEMDYWISQYDGADLRSGKFACTPPRLPAMSKQNEEINRIGAKVEAWQNCYNGFVENLNAANPLTQRIPKDIGDLLTKDEHEAAKKHLAAVYASVVAEARIASSMFLADFGAWRNATDAYVSEHNRMVKDVPPKPRPY